MGKQVEIPRYNVVSMRVSDEERESLLSISRERSLTISEMMRKAMADITRDGRFLQAR